MWVSINARAWPVAEAHIVAYARGRVHGSAVNQLVGLRFVSYRLHVGNPIATHFRHPCCLSLQVINQLPVERVNPDVESSSKNSDVRHRTVVGFRLLAVLAWSGRAWRWGRAPRRRWSWPWRSWPALSVESGSALSLVCQRARRGLLVASFHHGAFQHHVHRAGTAVLGQA